MGEGTQSEQSFAESNVGLSKAAQPEPKSQIGATMSRLHHEANVLGELTSSLRDRLGVVLHPAEADVSDIKQTIERGRNGDLAQVAPLAATIDQVCGELSASAGRVRDILERLELPGPGGLSS